MTIITQGTNQSLLKVRITCTVLDIPSPPPPTHHNHHQPPPLPAPIPPTPTDSNIYCCLLISMMTYMYTALFIIKRWAGHWVPPRDRRLSENQVKIPLAQRQPAFFLMFHPTLYFVFCFGLLFGFSYLVIMVRPEVPIDTLS